MKQSLTPDSIIRTLKENKAQLETFSVSRIGLFGSFSRGEAKTGSDIDFLVEFNIPSFDNYMGLKLYLEDLFQRKVDLVTERGIKPSLIHIKQEAIYA